MQFDRGWHNRAGGDAVGYRNPLTCTRRHDRELSQIPYTEVKCPEVKLPKHPK